MKGKSIQSTIVLVTWLNIEYLVYVCFLSIRSFEKIYVTMKKSLNNIHFHYYYIYLWQIKEQ